MRDGEHIYCWRVRGRLVCAYSSGSIRQRLASLSLFPRTSLKRRWLYWGMRSAVLLGVDRLLMCKCEKLDALLSNQECCALVERIKQLYHSDTVEWLITWPAMVTRRRLYLLYRIPARSVVGVVKIGAGGFNRQQLENEASVLARLAEGGHPFAMPRVRLQETWSDARVMLMLDGFPAVLRAVSKKKAIRNAAAICRYLQSLDVPMREVSLMDATWYPSVREHAREMPATYEAVWAHGDLGPGNMAMLSDGRVFLFDWENASCEAPKETDRVGFWLALHQDEVLGDPRQGLSDLMDAHGDIPEDAVKQALCYLAAHDNLAAVKIWEKERRENIEHSTSNVQR